MKTSLLALQRQLERTGKSYFTIHDMRKFYPGTSGSLKVLLSQWAKKKYLHRIGRGIYALSPARLNLLQLAHALDPTSYVSFEYALHYHHAIDQVPSVITLATRRRHRLITLANAVLEYTKLKDDLCFGYEVRDKANIATPEKALLDLVYLMTRGMRTAALDTLDTRMIDRHRLRALLARFPFSVKQMVETMKLL